MAPCSLLSETISAQTRGHRLRSQGYPHSYTQTRRPDCDHRRPDCNLRRPNETVPSDCISRLNLCGLNIRVASRAAGGCDDIDAGTRRVRVTVEYSLHRLAATSSRDILATRNAGREVHASQRRLSCAHISPGISPQHISPHLAPRHTSRSHLSLSLARHKSLATRKADVHASPVHISCTHLEHNNLASTPR